MNTIRHRAWLAWRSPPGLSRWRMVLPDDAGMGAAAHRCAQAASLRSRSGWSPAAMSSSAAVLGPIPRRASSRGACAVTSGTMSSSSRSSWPPGELSPPSQLTQCDAGGVADDVAGAGPQRRSPGHQGSRGVPCEPGPQVIRPGQHQCPGLVDGLGAFSGGAAFGDHERPDRLDGAVPALRCTAGPARLGRAGGADGIQRVRLALPAPVLAVGAVHLHHPDTGRGDVAGQARAVTAGALDPDQAHGPEPAQPPQEKAVSGRGSRELLDTEQPSKGIERGGDVHVGMGVHAAGDGACLYDGQCHLFSLVEGMARTRWPSDLGTPASSPGRADQTGTPVGARKPGPGRQIVSQDNPNGVSRIGGQAGPRPPTLRPHPAKSGKQGRKHYPHSPCRIFAAIKAGRDAMNLGPDLPILRVTARPLVARALLYGRLTSSRGSRAGR